MIFGVPNRGLVGFWLFVSEAVRPFQETQGKDAEKLFFTRPACKKRFHAFPADSKPCGQRGREEAFRPGSTGMRLDQIQFRPGFLEHVLPVLLERGIGEHGFDIADIGHPDHGGTAEFGIVRG